MKVGESTANGSRGRTLHTMALDQFALLEVLEALKGGDVEERVRQGFRVFYGASPALAAGRRVAKAAGHSR